MRWDFDAEPLFLKGVSFQRNCGAASVGSIERFINWVDNVMATVKRFKTLHFEHQPFIEANQGIVDSVLFIYSNMELRYLVGATWKTTE